MLFLVPTLVTVENSADLSWEKDRKSLPEISWQELSAICNLQLYKTDDLDNYSTKYEYFAPLYLMTDTEPPILSSVHCYLKLYQALKT